MMIWTVLTGAAAILCLLALLGAGGLMLYLTRVPEHSPRTVGDPRGHGAGAPARSAAGPSADPRSPGEHGVRSLLDG